MKIFDYTAENLRSSLMIEASAGTGKTYTLERIYRRLILEYGLTIDQILVMTFTEKAASELKERIYSLLKITLREDSLDASERKNLLRALSSFSHSEIHTIHSFCKSSLERWPLESSSLFRQSVENDKEQAISVIRNWIRENGQQLHSLNVSEDNLKSLGRLLDNNRMDSLFRRIPERKIGQVYKKLGSDFSDSLSDLHRIINQLSAMTDLPEILDDWRAAADIKKQSMNPLAGREKISTLFLCDSFNDFISKFNTTVSGKKSNFFRLLAFKAVSPDHSSLSLLQKLWDKLSPLLINSGDGKYNVLDADKRELWQESDTLMAQCSVLLQDLRAREGMRNFDDLILDLEKNLDNKLFLEKISGKYQVALVDEFQDTDYLQWSIISRIFTREGHNYILVGDPKQSIYRFRGGDLAVYQSARQKTGEENCFHLGTNFRSAPSLVDANNILFGHVFSPSLHTGSAPVLSFQNVNSGSEAPLLFRGNECERPVTALSGENIKNSDDYLSALSDHIAALLSDSSYKINGESVKPEHIAVLVEKNRQGRELKKLLALKQVPAVIFQDRNLYEQEEALHLHYLLQFLLNPEDSSCLKRVLLGPFYSLGPSVIQALEESGALDCFRLAAQKFLADSQNSSVKNSIIAFLNQSGLPGQIHQSLYQRLLSGAGGEQKLVNLTCLLEELDEAYFTRGCNLRLMTQEFEKKCLSVQNAAKKEVRLEKDLKALRIYSIHKSKGLQFPVVYTVIGLQSSTYSGKQNDFYQFVDTDDNQVCRDYLKQSESRALSLLEEWEEKKRLFYVACTRAVSKLYVPFVLKDIKHDLPGYYQSLMGTELIKGKPLHLLTKSETPETDFSHKTGEWFRQHEDLFSIEDFTDSEGSFYRSSEQADPADLVCPDTESRFHENNLLTTSSFSSLVRQGDSEKHDRDYDFQETVSVSREGVPAGPLFGEMIHSIFEEIPFAEAAEAEKNEIVRDQVKGICRRYFPEVWVRKHEKTVLEIITGTVHKKLEPLKNISLAELDVSTILPELEFRFRIKENQKLEVDDNRLTLKKGYLKGFIDLVFLFGGKYYFADWKSNLLPDYSDGSMKNSMKEHNYYLQGQLYTLALVKMLERMNPNFNYEENFGGYFYFFVRGMKENEKGFLFFSPEPYDELPPFDLVSQEVIQ